MEVSETGIYYIGEKTINLDFRYKSEFIIREGITSIGSIYDYYESDDCPGILILPESVKSIESIRASLNKIVISDNNKHFCTEDGILFSKDKKSLIRYPGRHEREKYVVPDGVKKIEENAFYKSKNLTSVVLPDTVEFIGKEAFDNTPLERVELTVHPITVGEYAFPENTILSFKYKDLCIPLVLVDNWRPTNDGKMLAEFISTEDLEKQKSLYDHIKKSEYKAFMAFYLSILHDDEDCRKYIKRSKNRWSANLIDLYADLVEYVLDKSKEADKPKKSENKKKKDPPLSKWSFVSLSDGSYEIEKYKGKDTIIEVPDMFRGMPIKSIGENAFSGDRRPTCTRIEKVIIPEGIEAIKKCAFFRCSNLTEVILPESLKQIDDSAFNNCESLKEIKIPDSVAEIGQIAFGWCKQLKEFRFPSQVTTINAFSFIHCSELTKITVGKAVISIARSAFDFCDKLETVEIVDDDGIKTLTWEEYSREKYKLVEYGYFPD